MAIYTHTHTQKRFLSQKQQKDRIKTTLLSICNYTWETHRIDATDPFDLK